METDSLPTAEQKPPKTPLVSANAGAIAGRVAGGGGRSAVVRAMASKGLDGLDRHSERRRISIPDVTAVSCQHDFPLAISVLSPISTDSDRRCRHPVQLAGGGDEGGEGATGSGGGNP